MANWNDLLNKLERHKQLWTYRTYDIQKPKKDTLKLFGEDGTFKLGK